MIEVFNNTGDVIVTGAGQPVGGYESATVDAGDVVVEAGLADGRLTLVTDDDPPADADTPNQPKQRSGSRATTKEQ